MLIFLLFFANFSFAQEASLYLEPSTNKQSIISNDFYQFDTRHSNDTNIKSEASNNIFTPIETVSEKSVNASDKLGRTLLHWSIINKDIFLFFNTLKLGANVNLADHEGKTPLHMAVEAESLEMIETLINHGAIVNARDKQGLTPLHNTALLPQGMLIADYLIIYGAAPFTQDNNGRTALDWARINSNRPMMAYLSGVERNFFRPEDY
ncbi:Ankyrin repeat [Brevinema andersonii]|uniref:Ankyrin repeat n=1 Tax=Brevinema andersonii TaxID=34097 RepID=A0A1I1DHH4_BREAD|nr:ankyrin repeat domain-containing protein [Brevinema andersonii]SFB74274.1 Ankyrin repeat [Brevinema andersonii]